MHTNSEGGYGLAKGCTFNTKTIAAPGCPLLPTMCHGMRSRRGGPSPGALLLCLHLALSLGPARASPSFSDSDACTNPSVPDYGYWTPNVGVFFENAVVRFHCLEGYKLTGPPKKQCLRHYNGSLSWKPIDETECLPEVLDCRVPHVEDADVHNKTYSPGDQLIIRCREGFHTRYPDLDSMVSVCQDDGSWDNVPVCQGVACGRWFFLTVLSTYQNISHPSPWEEWYITSAFLDISLKERSLLSACITSSGLKVHPSALMWKPCESYNHGTVVEFYCDHGYMLTNDYRFITCRNGEWVPSYQVHCVQTEKSWTNAQETLLATWKILAFTASSVLIVLLLVIIAKVFQSRFKAFLIPSGTLDNSVDPDFVVVDGVPVMLPTYDEAVSSDLNASAFECMSSAGQRPSSPRDDQNLPEYPGNMDTDLLPGELQTQQNFSGFSEALDSFLPSPVCQLEASPAAGSTSNTNSAAESAFAVDSTSPMIDIADEIPLVDEEP
ncbi:sushi domain-containing protein 4 isoform X2 [Lissotriton helveticus]